MQAWMHIQGLGLQRGQTGGRGQVGQIFAIERHKSCKPCIFTLNLGLLAQWTVRNLPMWMEADFWYAGRSIPY